MMSPASPVKPCAETTIPVFREPSQHEATFYYASFPSSPRLLGRTSSATVPWFFSDTWPPRDKYYPFGREEALESATASGPVGPHAIHALWETTTRQKVMEAISPLDWTSIDVLRIGRTTLAEKDRPIIVWVGVASRSVERGDAPWPVVANVLGRVRGALDSDGLTDVECEVRISDTSAATGPRLIAPAHGIERLLQQPWEVDATQLIATTIGQAIAPRNSESTEGTLGLYLAPAATPPNTDTAGAGIQGGPVWALTCHHVVCPPDSKHDPDAGRETKGQGKTAGEAQKNKGKSKESGQPVDVLLPPISLLKSALGKAQEAVGTAQRLIEDASSQGQGNRRPSGSLTAYRETLVSQTRLLDTLKAFVSEADRVVGYVHHSPPIRTNVNPSFTRDWALVALDKSKFPAGHSLANVVDLQTDRPESEPKQLVRKILGNTQFDFPADGMMRLNGVIPLQEMRGAPIPHQLVTTIGDEKCLVVLKRGRTTGLTAGIALDIRSVTRNYMDYGMPEEISYEWAIQHVDAKSKDRSYSGGMSQFSRGGDSGSVIFDLTGRIGGLLTGGTGYAEGNMRQYDLAYATPMVYVLQDIEKELGKRVRIL